MSKLRCACVLRAGHEVLFHRTSAGGSCDCGDAEAWQTAGCCPEHKPITQTADGADAAADADPVSAVPEPFASAVRALVRALLSSVVRIVWDSLNGFEPFSLNAWGKQLATDLRKWQAHL